MDSSNCSPRERTAHLLRTVVRTIAWVALLGMFLISRGTWWTARAQVTGLVAAYGFDEGTGTAVADSSGNGNTGTIANATWTPSGKFGSALSFNGTNARVTIPDSSSLDLIDAMTLEAWVYPTVAPAAWRSVVNKDVDRYYLMASSDNQNHPAVGGTFGTTNLNAFGAATLPVNAWTHLAATYDRTTIRLYVNGIQVSSVAQTQAMSASTAVLTIGADFYGEYFTGLIDEVRIYNRALTSGEIQIDSGTPLASGPHLVINQPAAGSSLAATTIDVAYSTTGDLTGVNHVHFRLDGNPEVMDLSFDGAYQFTGVPAGAHTLSGYLVHADHSAFPGSNTFVNFTTTVLDPVPPTVSIMSPTSGATVSGVITVSANAADAVGVVGVQLKLDGANLGTEDLTAPYAVQLNTATLADGSHTVQAVARDLGGNVTTSTMVSFTVSNGSPTGPAAIGQWSAPFTWPIVGLHAALLPTGKILSWADHSDGGGVQLWNPATGTFTSKPFTSSNLFCAGLTFLADGRLLVNGGHISNYFGTRNTAIFDPWSESWVPAANMTYGRWYPTSTTLADGRVLTWSGGETCSNCAIPGDPHNGLADIGEIYNPATNLWSQLTSAARRLPMYPHMFLLPDGRVFASSANMDPIASAVLNLGTNTWTQIGPVLDGGSAAMYAPGKIIKSGSAWSVDYPIASSAATTYVIDMNAPSPAWRQTPSMAFRRTEHTLTVLPDGSTLVTGGSGDSNVYDLGPAVYEAEIWSPTTETWTTMARMDVPRHYHSTAILLPDARVLIEGSGTFGINQLTAQIYSPPYLFKGARPVITSAPSSASYGSAFTVQTPDAARIGSVTAMAITAVTHAFNMNQRIVPLSFQAGAGSLNVTLPANTNLMPPGYYMLFLVDTNGVPSVSTMLKVTSTVDTVPPTAPSNLVASPSGTQVTLNWTVATDNVGVTGYRVERCSGAGCSNFAQIATPASPTYVDAGLAATTSYSYRVRATDAVGLLGPYSNTATALTGATVPPPPGLVAAYGFNEGSGGTVSDASSSGIIGTIAAASWTTAGKYGSALSFNGTTSYVDLGNPAALQLTGSMTIEAWIKAAANPADDGQIVAKSNSTGWQFKTSPDTGPHTFGLGVSPTSGSITQRYSTTVRSLDTWYHVAGVYNATAGTLSTYVNGVLDNGTLLGAIPAAQFNQAVNVNIGRRTGGFYFNGLIDEVRIYNSVLTQAQIQADMNTPIGTTPPDTVPPTVALTAPAPGASVSAVATLTASASDNVGVAGVQFLLDGANLGAEVTGPGPTYSFSWNTATTANGAHTLSARARDAANNTATATNVNVTVANDTTPPTVALTSPAAGATLNGSISIMASASDNGTLAGVQFLLDGANLGAEVTGPGPTYSFSWNTATTANGAHTLSARARDAANNTATATNVNVTVANTTPDTTPPSVSLTAPAAGATLIGTVTVTATATDNVAMAGVQFLLDGGSLGAEVTGPGPTYTYSWNTTTAGNGAHTVSARARDGASNTAITANRNVTVSNTAPSGLVAAYSFDAGNGPTAVDSSGNGIIGTLSGATWTTAGKYGNALSFNGATSYVDLGNPAVLQLTGSMTIEAWIKAAADPADDGQIVAKSDGTGWQFKTSPDTGPHTFGLGVSGSAGSMTQRYSTTVRSLNTWYHVAGVYNATAGTLSTYVNGVLDNGTLLGAIPAAQFNQAVNVNIGRRTGGFYFNGVIDEVRIYNGVLTQAQIQADMNTPIGTTPPDTVPPTVALTAPAPGASVSALATLTASASDNVGVAGVQFLLDGANLGAEVTGPGPTYNFSWNTATATNGAHTLSARARDAANNTATATNVTVTVANDTTPPTVALTSPAAGATLNGSISIMASASDNGTLAGVQFLLDGANLGAEVTGPGPTYSFSWNTATATNGAHTLSARARDAANNTATATNVNVTVANTTPDTTPPSVSLTAPAAGATLIGTVTVRATATDNIAMAGVQFLLDGASLGAEVTGPGPTYTYSWNTTTAGNGAHTVSARARDAASNTATAAGVNITVFNDTTPPVVSLTSPTAGATLNGTTALVASASDNGTLAGVQFRLDGVDLGAEVTGTGPTYTFSWNTTTATNGPHTLSARARDAATNTALAANVNITVFNDTTPPVVSLTSPTAGATLTGTTALVASASDNGTLAGVQFRLDGVDLGAEVTGTGPTYTFSWNTTTATNGPHTVSARARDAATNTALAANVNISVFNDTTPPVVSLTSPGAGAILNGTISIVASASDNGTLAGVQFRLDGANLGAEVIGTGPTYTFSWNTTTATNGPHTLSARARDAATNTALAANVNISVFNDTTPPVVSLTSPAAGATVYGTISIVASASDNGTLAGMQFLLDGANLGAELTGPGPTYTYTWNTTTTTDGAHTVSARARDAANNTATAANLGVTVANVPPGLLAAYSFNAGIGTTAADSSGNAITGTLSGATWTTAGKYGNALSFNGTSFVNLGNPPALAGTGSMTWTAWVYATGIPADDGHIIAKSDNASGWQFKTSPDTGPHTFAISVSGSTDFVQRYSTTVRALNTWYHVAGVYNAATRALDIYVNGVLDNGVLVGTIPASQTVPNLNVDIGRRATGFYFAGVIDDVRVYNRALSPTEIQAVKSVPLP